MAEWSASKDAAAAELATEEDNMAVLHWFCLDCGHAGLAGGRKNHRSKPAHAAAVKARVAGLLSRQDASMVSVMTARARAARHAR